MGFAAGQSYAQRQVSDARDGKQLLAAGKAARIVVLTLSAFVAGCVARAAMSMSGLDAFPPGFADESAALQPRAQFKDLQALLVGLVFATLAIVLAEHVGGTIGSLKSSLEPNRSFSLSLSTLCSTFSVACHV